MNMPNFITSIPVELATAVPVDPAAPAHLRPPPELGELEAYFPPRPAGDVYDVQVLSSDFVRHHLLIYKGADAGWWKWFCAELARQLGTSGGWQPVSEREVRAWAFGFLEGLGLRGKRDTQYSRSALVDGMLREGRLLPFPNSEDEDNRLVEWLRGNLLVHGADLRVNVPRAAFTLSGELIAAWCEEHAEERSHTLAIELAAAVPLAFPVACKRGDLRKSTRLGPGRSKAGWLGCQLVSARFPDSAPIRSTEHERASALRRGGLEGSAEGLAEGSTTRVTEGSGVVF